MSQKLYVGNLSFQLEEKTLEDAFAAHGNVKSVKIITDFETGRSRGFGFVEMETADEAESCISELDGKELDGRALRVSVAKERAPRGDRGPRRPR